jgi:hypothetical protein
MKEVLLKIFFNGFQGKLIPMEAFVFWTLATKQFHIFECEGGHHA